MPLSPVKKLTEWEEYFGGRIKASTLRAEILAGNLRCIRPRDSCNAPILVSEDQLEAWLHLASKRRTVLSPSETRVAIEAANPESNADVSEAS